MRMRTKITVTFSQNCQQHDASKPFHNLYDYSSTLNVEEEKETGATTSIHSKRRCEFKRHKKKLPLPTRKLLESDLITIANYFFCAVILWESDYFMNKYLCSKQDASNGHYLEKA